MRNLCCVFLLSMTVAQAGDLEEWFAKPLASRGGISKNLEGRTFATADEAKASEKVVWAAYRAGRVKTGANNDFPALPPTLDEIRKIPEKNRPQLTPSFLQEGDVKMPFILVAKGKKPATGWPFYIALHGGGGTAEKLSGPHAWPVNTGEWQAQLQLFQSVYPDGMYFIPRMANDNDGRWYYDYCQVFYDRAIRAAIADRDADPNRVYLMGISEGGYAAYRVAAHMADRFAGSCSMAAAEPMENAPPENFRNLAFRCDIGEKDSMFDRIGLARRFFEKLDVLSKENDGAYVHSFNPQAGRGHGISYSEGPAWISQYVRKVNPKIVTWTAQKMHNTLQQQSYWLELAKAPETLPLFVQAEISGNTIAIKVEQQNAEKVRVPATGVSLRVYLNDALVNLDKPVQISINGKQVHQGLLPRQLSTQMKTMAGRGDPLMIFSAEKLLEL